MVAGAAAPTARQHDDAVTDVGSLTVVGCSGSIPGPDSACSCYLVELGGYRLLMDLGTGAIGPLRRHVDASEVDSVFITHAHGDHCHDLWGLAMLRDKAGRRDPLVVHGPPGVRDALAENGSGVDDWFTFAGAPEQIGPWRVRTATVRHSVENWAVRLDDRVCYTGDTEPCPELDDLAHGCTVLLAEAGGLDGARPRSHLTAGDAGRLATRAGARLLVLTHLRPGYEAVDVLGEAARAASCPVILAAPGLTLAV